MVNNKIRVAVLVDNMSITHWQSLSLEMSSDLIEVAAIYSCKNRYREKRKFAHLAYYCLNLIALRNRMSRKVPISNFFCDVVHFDADVEGAWESLPPEVVEDAISRGVHCIIKFGMGLLRIPTALKAVDILSFHHGDPRHYRGRPAGFYELLEGAEKQGVMVQQLSDKLDAGNILALCHFKISHHSYRKTSERFYSGSPIVLRRALQNLKAGKPLTLEALGKNCRLPTNLLVIKFAAMLARRKISRLIYGLFFEKSWKVAVQPGERDSATFHLTDEDIERARTLETPKGFRFLADPFLSLEESAVYVEGLSANTHVGEILRFDLDTGHVRKILHARGHYSYPSLICHENQKYILPESANHKDPFIFNLIDDREDNLTGLEGKRLIDPTLHKDGEAFYLFGGRPEESSDVLRLYCADQIEGPYYEHPKSPVIVDPEGSRMGGNIISVNNRLFRLGQNNCFHYGDGLILFEINKLSRNYYSESVIAKFRFRNVRGPHTLNYGAFGRAFDYYTDQISLFSGVRRILARVKSS